MIIYLLVGIALFLVYQFLFRPYVQYYCYYTKDKRIANFIKPISGLIGYQA